MSTTRRDVLRGIGVGAAGVLAGLPLGVGTRSAHAQNGGGYKVLEIFLAGGLSGFETLFVPEDTVLNMPTADELLAGASADGEDPFAGTAWPSGNCWPTLHDPGAWTDAEPDHPSVYGSQQAWGYQPTATYSSSITSGYQFQLSRSQRIAALRAAIPTYWTNPVEVTKNWGSTSTRGYLGPAFATVAGTPLMQNASVVALEHHLNAHPPGVHVMLTGTTMGRSYAHGLGARVRATYEAGTDLSVPSAFILNIGQGFAYANMAASSGTLGAENRPPLLAIGRGAAYGDFQTYLPRAPFLATDPTLARYRDRYDAQIGGARSGGFDAYRATFDLARVSPALTARLGTQQLNSASNPKGNVNQAIKVAAHLLGQAETQYVCVLTGGFDNHTPAGGQNSVDKRVLSSFTTTFNLFEVLEALNEYYAQLGSNTLIVLNTEFGRRHEAQGGSGHWAQSTAVMLLGGPVAPGVQLNGGSFGFTSDADIWVDPGEQFDAPVGPAHLRKAIALAAGVPFANTADLGDDATATDDQFLDAIFGQG